MASSEVCCPKRCLTELRGQMPKTRLYWPASVEPGADSQQYTVCLPVSVYTIVYRLAFSRLYDWKCKKMNVIVLVYSKYETQLSTQCWKITYQSTFPGKLMLQQEMIRFELWIVKIFKLWILSFQFIWKIIQLSLYFTYEVTDYCDSLVISPLVLFIFLLWSNLLVIVIFKHEGTLIDSAMQCCFLFPFSCFFLPHYLGLK